MINERQYLPRAQVQITKRYKTKTTVIKKKLWVLKIFKILKLELKNSIKNDKRPVNFRFLMSIPNCASNARTK